MFRVLVCMKQVVDHEIPPSAFKIDSSAMAIIPPSGSPPVLSPYDENALEAALRIRDEQECEITVISLGSKLAKPILRKVLAVGADHLVLVKDERLELFDSFTIAVAIGKYIHDFGPFDLIFCGRQASDTNASMVGVGISEIMGYPVLPLVSSFALESGSIQAKCETTDGNAVFQAPLPSVLTVTSEIGDLRMATVKASIAAKKKKIVELDLDSLGVDPAAYRKETLGRIEEVSSRRAQCMIFKGETDVETGHILARQLIDNAVLKEFLMQN